MGKKNRGKIAACIRESLEGPQKRNRKKRNNNILRAQLSLKIVMRGGWVHNRGRKGGLLQLSDEAEFATAQ
jgi:hypothetical protein